MAAQLFAIDSFPVPLKTKAIYFVKIAKVVVPKHNPSSVLIIGDMASKPIEQLATIVDDVSIKLGTFILCKLYFAFNILILY